MSQFSRPYPDPATSRPRSSPADNTPVASRTLSESSVEAYSGEAAPAYSLVYVPESERGLQAVPRSLLPMRVTSEDAHQEALRTATAYHYLVMVIFIRVIAASIGLSNSVAFSTSGKGDADKHVHDNDVGDEGHALSGGSEQPAATLRDSEPVRAVRPSTVTRGDSRNAWSKRSPEGTDDSGSSAMDAERGGQEGLSDGDGKTL